MPNRLLKESICSSENIDKLTAFQETFFYRLIVNCDDYGRMDARPKILASKLYPLKDVRLNHIKDALRALSSAELVTIYEVDGKPFLQMKTWERHQQIRAQKSKYPAPENGTVITDDSNGNQLISDDSKCPRNPIQSNPIRNPIRNQNPTRARARETVSEDDPAFTAFWEQYPVKVAKHDALKAWEKLKPDSELIGKIMTGLSKWISSEEWKRDGGRYIPHPATWINGRRWEDEVRQASKGPAVRVIAQDFDQRDYSDVQDDEIARLNAEMRKAREAGII